jgi:hypothetical protein
MAQIHHSMSARRWTDAIADQFVICSTHSGKTFLTSAPGFAFEASRDSQPTLQEACRAAATYAVFAETQDVYIRRAKGTGVTAYELALFDWFGRPNVLQIDVDTWTGKNGQVIRVKARDNIMVARVAVVIRDVQGNIREAGEAVRSEASSAWWIYTTRSPVPLAPFPSVEAIAWDLPGNRDSFVIN